MEPITLDSGVKLDILHIPFESAHKLLQEVMKEVEGVNLLSGPMEFSKNVMARFIYSPGLTAALWECMSKCLYNGQKITAMTFDDVKAREDFLTVAQKVLEVSLAPFGKSLGSLSKTMFGKVTGFLVSKEKE